MPNLRVAALGWVLVICSFMLLTACGSDNRLVGEFYTDWDRTGACQGDKAGPWGLSLAGTMLGPCMFPGRFVWITYDALWCSACREQTAATSAAARERLDDVVFLSVLTGGREVFVSASDEEVRNWAGEYGLDPRFVVSEGSSSRTVPQHALIGPDGRTWYRYVGLVSADEMRSTLDAFRSGKRAPVLLDDR